MDTFISANPVLVWIVAGAAIITALIVIGKALWGALRFARGTTHFFDDWFGVPERDGKPARPGVMAQLEKMRADQVNNSGRLDAIEYQLTPNGGGSMRDAVDRVERMVDGQTG